MTLDPAANSDERRIAAVLHRWYGAVAPMGSNDIASTCSAIEAFLGTEREARQRRATRCFWTLRPVISRAEIEMVRALIGGPLCADGLAARLGRDIDATRSLLDAMVAVGILEMCGEWYHASGAAVAYFDAMAPDAPPLWDEE